MRQEAKSWCENRDEGSHAVVCILDVEKPEDDGEICSEILPRVERLKRGVVHGAEKDVKPGKILLNVPYLCNERNLNHGGRENVVVPKRRDFCCVGGKLEVEVVEIMRRRSSTLCP